MILCAPLCPIIRQCATLILSLSPKKPDIRTHTHTKHWLRSVAESKGKSLLDCVVDSHFHTQFAFAVVVVFLFCISDRLKCVIFSEHRVVFFNLTQPLIYKLDHIQWSVNKVCITLWNSIPVVKCVWNEAPKDANSFLSFCDMANLQNHQKKTFGFERECGGWVAVTDQTEDNNKHANQTTVKRLQTTQIAFIRRN